MSGYSSSVTNAHKSEKKTGSMIVAHKMGITASALEVWYEITVHEKIRESHTSKEWTVKSNFNETFPSGRNK